MFGSRSRSERFASWVLLAGIISCSVFLVIVFSRYRFFATTPRVVFLYVAPTLVLAMLAGSLALPPRHKVNMALSFSSVVVALYAGEIVLSLRTSPQTLVGVAEALGSTDRRTRLEVVEQLREEGVQAYPSLSAWVLRRLTVRLDGEVIMPLTPGLAGSTVVSCQEADGWMVYDTDEHGFNNPPGIWDGAPVDIVLIGDSYTQGECVPPAETMAGRIRNYRPATLNLGVTGAGPLFELAVLREFGPDIQPRLVFWVYFEDNDLSDLRSEIANPILRRYLEDGYSQGSRRHQAAIDEQLVRLHDSIMRDAKQKVEEGTVSANLGDRLKAVVTLDNLRGIFGLGLTPPTAVAAWFPQILEAAKRTVESWGGELHFVYLPTYSRYTFLGAMQIEGRAAVLALASRLGIPVVDMHEAFKALEDPQKMWVHPRGHLGRQGYAAVAEAILEAIAGPRL